MNKEILDILNNSADEFGKIAKKVNESSKKRKSFSEEAIKYINLCLEIGQNLDRDMESVSKANIDQRNKDTIVFNTCKILKSNIEGQRNILNELQSKNLIKKDFLEQISSKVKEFTQTLEEALANIQKIIENDNRIILYEKLVKIRKDYQFESIQTLKNLAAVSLKDAETAIEGSSANLERGLNMVERFKNTEKYVKEKNLQEINKLIDEANNGWNVALKVNKSSNAQFLFAEKVNKFTSQLFEDTTAIKNFVVRKHLEFEENLQVITVLTVILSIKFKKYLNIEEMIESIEINDNMRDLMINLAAYMKIACKDILEVTALNYDMAESSNLNNVVEDNTVKATEKELAYLQEIKMNVEQMTEATKYPVEGSSKNITNGQVLEKYLTEILDSFNR